MSDQELKRICPNCAGRGTISPDIDAQGNRVYIPCNHCSGTKYVPFGIISGVMPTYKILEATDSNEYAALDANKKAWYNLFISAGTLDMSDGTKAQGIFLDWLFPAGTNTNTAILAIL